MFYIQSSTLVPLKRGLSQDGSKMGGHGHT